MASHEIRVRMRKKNVAQFEPIFGEISEVLLYVSFWIDYNSFTSRCDDIRNVRESRNKESLNIHWISFATASRPEYVPCCPTRSRIRHSSEPFRTRAIWSVQTMCDSHARRFGSKRSCRHPACSRHLPDKSFR